MILSDLGADVLRIQNPARGARSPELERTDLTNRGRRSVGLDLRQSQAIEAALTLVEKADALIEPYRPGVAERLGVGPEACLARNPSLVYARMTGWGQDGPMAQRAGHDINYIALSGVLSLLGRAGERPLPPMNLVADFGGGAMLCAVGILAGVMHARAGGTGQVVDVAMLDGASWLATMVHTLRAWGRWGPRGTNLLDTGAPFYEVYETSDGKYMSVGAIEPQFYAELLVGLGIDSPELRASQQDESTWPALKERFAEIFATRTRAEWTAVFEDVDACATPVLDLDEAADHPHLRQRETYVTAHGALQPAPAPRFGETPGEIQRVSPLPGEHTREALADWGLDERTIEEMIRSGAAIAVGET
jgi:alpha-methylacyl-CoA racemase